MTERWKPIESGKYKVSTMGRIFNVRLNRMSKVTYRKKTGYGRVTINSKSKYLHRVIAETFILNSLDKPQVSHLNGNPKDNRVFNLAWATAKENCRLKEIHGTAQKGSKNGFSKLTESEVSEIKSMLSSGISRKTIGTKYRITNATISGIKTGKSWRHVIE